MTISSRSFGVADKIKSGLGVAGPVIDNYANLLLEQIRTWLFYLFPSVGGFAGLFAVLKNSSTPAGSAAVCSLSVKSGGQTDLADANTGKYPVTPLKPGNPRGGARRC